MINKPRNKVWNQRIHRNRKNHGFFMNQRQKLLRLLPKRNRVRKANMLCEFVVEEQVVEEGRKEEEAGEEQVVEEVPKRNRGKRVYGPYQKQRQREREKSQNREGS